MLIAQAEGEGPLDVVMDEGFDHPFIGARVAAAEQVVFQLNELGPAGHRLGRLGGELHRAEKPFCARPAACAQVLLQQLSQASGHGGVVGLPLQNGNCCVLTKQLRTLETYQTAKRREALGLGQSSQVVHCRELFAVRFCAVVCKNVTHLFGVAFGRKIDLQKPQQISCAGGYFGIVVVFSAAQSVEGIKADPGQLLLCPAADVVTVVAELLDELVDVILRSRAGWGRRRLVGFIGRVCVYGNTDRRREQGRTGY